MANNYFILAALSVCPWSTYADIDLKFGVGPSISEENTDREWFGLVGLEFSNNEYFSLGTNYAYLSRPSGSQNALEIYGRGQYPLVYPLDIYADLGWHSTDNTLYIGLGVEYQISSKWAFELGYRYFDFSNTLYPNDTYAMHIGMKYRLMSSSIEKQIPNTSESLVAPRTSQALSDIKYSAHSNEQPLIQNQTPQEVCESKSVRSLSYTIVKDDWLIKIARQQHSSLGAILNNNTWLKERPAYVIYPGEIIWIPHQIEPSLCQNQTSPP